MFPFKSNVFFMQIQLSQNTACSARLVLNFHIIKKGSDHVSVFTVIQPRVDAIEHLAVDFKVSLKFCVNYQFPIVLISVRMDHVSVRQKG